MRIALFLRLFDQDVLESFMKIRRYCLITTLLLLAGLNQAAGQPTRFFRISGPAPTAITAFGPDGNLVWSNAQPGATYTVQSLSSLLPGGTNWVDYIQLPTTNAIHTNQLVDFNPPPGMAFIPAGVFTIGNSIGDPDITNATPTNVIVSSFYMDVNLVTYSQWLSVYNWATNHGYGFDNPGSGGAANQPVQNVDWDDCVKWCNARSQQEGLTPVYYSDANLTQVFTNGDLPQYLWPTNGPLVNWSANGYRLPTEAEWEKAARGGLKAMRFPWGNTISESQANYWGDTSGFSYDLGPDGVNPMWGNPNVSNCYSPVGYYPPNGYGLYDMAGNVDEWCWDFVASPPYPPGSAYLGGTDPHGPASGDERSARGGCWGDTAAWVRCASRHAYFMPSASDIFGFRCVRAH